MKKVLLKIKKENCDRSSLDRVEANNLERANSYLLVLEQRRSSLSVISGGSEKEWVESCILRWSECNKLHDCTINKYDR